jgi:CxxC motif-containing protein
MKNNEKKDLVCIVCPLGCRLTIQKDDTTPDGYVVEGNNCKRGAEYALKEMTNPTRVLTTTVVIDHALIPRLPVRSDAPVPKELLFKCMQEINRVRVSAPVQSGAILIQNILGTGVNIIASRSMDCHKSA